MRPISHTVRAALIVASPCLISMAPLKSVIDS